MSFVTTIETEVMGKITAAVKDAISVNGAAKALFPSAEQLATDIINNASLSDSDKKAKIAEDLKAVEGEIGSIAIGVGETLLGLVADAAFAYAKARLHL